VWTREGSDSRRGAVDSQREGGEAPTWPPALVGPAWQLGRWGGVGLQE
jgi:hypothetical protein